MEARTFSEQVQKVQEGLRQLFQQTGKPRWFEAPTIDIILDKSLPSLLQKVATDEVLHAIEAFKLETVQELAFYRQELSSAPYLGDSENTAPRIYLTPDLVTPPSDTAPGQLGRVIGVAVRQKGIIQVPAGKPRSLQESLRSDIVRYTLRHELGHLLGLLGHHDFAHDLGEQPYFITDYDSDKTQPCIMRAGVTVAPVDYCNRCKNLAHYARKTVAELHSLP